MTGVVVASQSTHRLLGALYAVRLRLFQIVIVSFVAAILLTAFAATTIVRPLTRLRRQATDFAERRGPLPSRSPAPAVATRLARSREPSESWRVVRTSTSGSCNPSVPTCRMN